MQLWRQSDTEHDFLVFMVYKVAWNMLALQVVDVNAPKTMLTYYAATYLTHGMELEKHNCM